jgi:4-hydroxy-tetrahydrodipicolinate synthase
VKEAMNMMGMEVGPVRSPLCAMSEANKAKMAKVMEAYGLKLV